MAQKINKLLEQFVEINIYVVYQNVLIKIND